MVHWVYPVHDTQAAQLFCWHQCHLKDVSYVLCFDSVTAQILWTKMFQLHEGLQGPCPCDSLLKPYSMMQSDIPYCIRDQRCWEQGKCVSCPLRVSRQVSIFSLKRFHTCGVYLRTCFSDLNWGRGRDATGLQWVSAKGVTQHSTMHLPVLHTQDWSGPGVSGAEAETFWGSG